MKITATLFCLLTSCAAIMASSAQDERIQQLHRELDRGKGTFSPDGFARSWGPPEKRDVIGQREFWTYYTSYGSRQSGGAYTNPYTRTTTYNGRSVDKYDKIVIEFADGLMVDWRAEVRR